MQEEDKTYYKAGGELLAYYFEPDTPPYIGYGIDCETNLYKWGHSLLLGWSADHDVEVEEWWEVSPATRGLALDYPSDPDVIQDYFSFNSAEVQFEGITLNPATGNAYEPQLVKKGDYTRVLAEFWADETQSIKWLRIQLSLSENQQLVKQWQGQGELLSDLEWEVKTAFLLAGTLHDACISSFGAKGKFDYVRPISAIREMASKGQCTDPLAINFHPLGIPLVDGLVETIEIGDSLLNEDPSLLGEIKFHAYKGPDEIPNSAIDVAGVGWIPYHRWFPYNRPTFITPSSSGYVSDQVSQAYAASGVLQQITGSAYFPGGLYSVLCPKNEYLVFEDGPTDSLALEFATYRDMAHSAGLAQLWMAAEHPASVSEGAQLGDLVSAGIMDYFTSIQNQITPNIVNLETPELINDILVSQGQLDVGVEFDAVMNQAIQPELIYTSDEAILNTMDLISWTWSNDSTGFFTFDLTDDNIELSDVSFGVINAESVEGVLQSPLMPDNWLDVDTKNPWVTAIDYNTTVVNSDMIDSEELVLTMTIDEMFVDGELPIIAWNESVATILELDDALSTWTGDSEVELHFSVLNEEIEIEGLQVDDVLGVDWAQNVIEVLDYGQPITIDTKLPLLNVYSSNVPELTPADAGSEAYWMLLVFDEPMNQELTPSISMPNHPEADLVLELDANVSGWINEYTYQVHFDLSSFDEAILDIDFEVSLFTDEAGNTGLDYLIEDYLDLTIPTGIEVLDNSTPRLLTNVLSGGQELILVNAQQVEGWSVVNVEGQVVVERNTLGDNVQLEIDTSALAAGTYFLSLRMLDSIEALPFVIR